jgi:hypothetical protein
MSAFGLSITQGEQERLLGDLGAFWPGRRTSPETPSTKDAGRTNETSVREATAGPPNANWAVDVLSNLYTVPVRSTVEAFLVHRRPLRTLLFDAYPRLIKIFGSDAKLELRLIEDMEDDVCRIRVSIRSGRDDARPKLERFDEEWWLDHIQNSDGLLNFVLRRE